MELYHLHKLDPSKGEEVLIFRGNTLNLSCMVYPKMTITYRCVTGKKPKIFPHLVFDNGSGWEHSNTKSASAFSLVEICWWLWAFCMSHVTVIVIKPLSDPSSPEHKLLLLLSLTHSTYSTLRFVFLMTEDCYNVITYVKCFQHVQSRQGFG